ncbi:uncharacterized protein LOC110085150 [Pogona vitticeps]
MAQHDSRMMQVHYQKPRRRFLRCCYCCIEVLSGFLLLMLVASVITLLRYFLEFADLPVKYAENKPELSNNETTTPVPPGRLLGHLSQSPLTNEMVSLPNMDPVKPTSPLTSAWKIQDPPQLPMEKSSPWTQIMVATRPTSAMTPGSSRRPPTSSLSWGFPHQLTLAPEKTPLHQLATATKAVSPQHLTSTERPTFPQQNTTVLTSSRNQTSATGGSSSQRTLATGWRSSLYDTTEPLPQHPTMSAKLTSPQWSATSAKLKSFPFSPAGSLATRWRSSTKLKFSQFSSMGSLATKWRSSLYHTTQTLPQHPTTRGKLTSPQQSATSAKLKPSLFSSAAPSSLQDTVQGTILATPPLSTVAINRSPLSHAASAMSLSPPAQLSPHTRLPMGRPSLPEALARSTSWTPTSSLGFISSQRPFSTLEVADPTGGNDTRQYFQGSFRLLSEAYSSSYSDPTSDGFRRLASKLEKVINDVFVKSALKKQYRESTVLAFEPEPMRAKFLLGFHDSPRAPKLPPSTVAQEMKRGYHEVRDAVLIEEDSIHVEDYNGICLIKPASSLPILTGVSHDQKHQKNPPGLGHGKNIQKHHEWPWVTTVLKDGHPICAGCLIAANWVLSAKSCVALDNLSLYTLKLGLSEKHTPPNELYTVARIIPHSSDIVLIQLAKSVPITSSAHPVCLPDPSRVTRPGTECWTLGSKGNHHSSKVLQWTVSSLTDCILTPSLALTCAKMSDHKKNLELTAGGPFVCSGEKGQIYLEGIVPLSAASQSKPKKKNEHQPTAFIQMAPLVPWIKSQLFP